MEATNGTMSVPRRDLKTMIATLPNFSGKDDKEMATWLEFHAAFSRIREINMYNQADVICQILTKIHSPAKNLIMTQDITSSVHSIIQRLQNIYGTPRQVLTRVIAQHKNVGNIPETGTEKVFSTLTSHHNLVDKTDIYLKSLSNKDHEEAMIILSHHAYELYSMLPMGSYSANNQQGIL